ncbi:urease accessory protein UreE [Phreatobacter sp. AB_2022a]|uniref:urease accessory protein UreE n=1 Tax=Phreatobacter sp. AB_2022a TaxID=3003134 RepID=UPI00228741CB|nr:urease accessory protein UreE [Phreatobacter sp. AB_2022a]MCZ0737091.1 urease accessory protein UreE [Phreatobacter sp. AB_2022a]
MIRAIEVLDPGSFADSAVIDRVVLDYDDRHRRRLAMEGVEGTAFLLDLAEAVPLVSDCGLKLEDGRIVLVVAAAEPLLEIRTKDPGHMVRVAWHLGNRHLPTQIMGAKLRIRRDHVIEEMARGLGAKVLPIEAPFDPEGGAYGHGTVTGHDHHHGHRHDDHGHHHHDHGHHHDHDHHGHGHAHKHKPGEKQGHGHKHGDGHKHEHGEKHDGHKHVHDDACGCGHDHGHHHHDHKHG